jgi:hypothetical protein
MRAPIALRYVGAENRLRSSARFARLEDRPIIFDSRAMARAGVFVSIDCDGELRQFEHLALELAPRALSGLALATTCSPSPSRPNQTEASRADSTRSYPRRIGREFLPVTKDRNDCSFPTVNS